MRMIDADALMKAGKEKTMTERSFDEMIAYFNRRVTDMDISRDSKMELLGMMAALGYKHKKSEQRWIPCSERLPEDIRPVLVTWKNNDPTSYYQYIVGKHFIGTAHYCKGKWYWYSSTTEDFLAEYGSCDVEEFDEAIEAVAWMPFLEPYREDKE